MDQTQQTRSISPSPNPLYCMDTETLQEENVADDGTELMKDEQKSKNIGSKTDEDDVDPVVQKDEDLGPYCDLNYPRVDCPERIVICLDFSSEMDKLSFRSRAGDKHSPMKLIKRALGLFLHTKSKFSSNHQFALVILQGEACWVCDWTSNPRDIIFHIEDLATTTDCDSFDLSTLFNTLKENVELPVVVGDTSVVPPPFIIRAILIYGRSHCLLNFMDKESHKFLESSPYFFLDAFYIHEPISEENNCEDTFNKLCELDYKGLSYVVETSRNPTKLHDFLAQLLAHPLQRPLQSDASYKVQLAEEVR